MLKVRVRFDKADDKKGLRLDGYADNFPEVGRDFSFTMPKKKHKIVIDLGKVYNIKSYGDMFLVQTELVVAEVWILGGEVENNAEILPFVKSRKTLFLKDGKITALQKKASAKGSFGRLMKLVDQLKEDRAFYDRKPKVKLTLVREVPK